MYQPIKSPVAESALRFCQHRPRGRRIYDSGTCRLLAISFRSALTAHGGLCGGAVRRQWFVWSGNSPDHGHTIYGVVAVLHLFCTTLPSPWTVLTTIVTNNCVLLSSSFDDDSSAKPAPDMSTRTCEVLCRPTPASVAMRPGLDEACFFLSDSLSKHGKQEIEEQRPKAFLHPKRTIDGVQPKRGISGIAGRRRWLR